MAKERSCRVQSSRVWRSESYPALVCALALATLVLCTGKAQGATGHQWISSLTGVPLSTGPLEPASLAVQRSSGHVFVADRFAGYVDVYGASGEYETQFGAGELEAASIAIDESSGDVYVADPFHEAVRVYEPDGNGGYRLLSQWFGASVPGGKFGMLSGVAVDNSGGPAQGRLYVLEEKTSAGGAAVDVYKPKPNPAEGQGGEGEFLGRLSGGKLEEPNGIAVAPGSGRILVADSLKGAIFAYSPSGEYEEKLNGKSSPNGPFNGKGEEPGNVEGIAVDGASGEIYVAEAERDVISQYSSKGAWEGWITETPEGSLGDPRGLALSAEGDVYLADAGLAVVDRFGPSVVVPDVETGKVAKATLTRTTAVLSGTINGDGIPGHYSFQYGETSALGSQTQSKSSGSGAASVSAEVMGLHAGRTYYYRIMGENENGTNVGLVRSFQTLPAVEELETGRVKEPRQEEVTVTGTLNPGGFDTHYYFQWGTTSTYGNSTPAPPGTDAGAGTSGIEAETLLTGLSSNTLYHYRLVGEDSFGVTYGVDKTFTTSGPPRISYEPPNEIGQTEATIHAQINPDRFETTYRFQYGETTAYGEEAPAGGEVIGAGSVPVARSATLMGLKVGASYHYRVLAENEAGTTEGPDQTFTTVPPAPVDATYATNVSATEATLHAQINPLGNDTHYYFQHGIQPCEPSPNACTNTPAPPGEDVGGGQGDVAGEVKLSGLIPGTTYHYRVLDSNVLGETQGHERTFTTQEQQPVAFVLPDGRAWEMVTPPDKEGAPVEALGREGGIILASTDGSRLTYVVDGALGEDVQGNRSPEVQQILATRGTDSWSSQDIVTPNTIAKGLTAGLAPEYQYFTADLSAAVVEPPELGGQAEPPLAPGVTQATIYLRDNMTGTYLPLVTEDNTAPGTQFGQDISFVSATPDLSHVVIASKVALTGPGSAAGLYLWSRGHLHLVSVLPSGLPAGGLVELGFFNRVTSHAISAGGSRIIWTQKTENSGRGHLYMRDVSRGETVHVDAAKGVAEPGQGSAEFQAASSDGSKIFFTDRQLLIPDATTEVGQAQTAGKPDLYECEVIEEHGKLACLLSDLTIDTHEREHAAVQGLVLGASEDGSSLFLIAQGVLASNRDAAGKTAVAGMDNLYELHHGTNGWSRIFIATLAGEDKPEWEGNGFGDPAFVTARVSPSGRYFAFMSAASLTGYDNIDASTQAKGARDEEVYLYDATTGGLRCASCNPSGARPEGVLDQNEAGEGNGLLVDRRKVWNEPGHERWLAGSIPGWTAQSLSTAVYQSRYLSDDGRLYFNSPDDLVPAASNHKEDVYEYEPSGVGSCESVTGGCVALVSGGTSTRESAFLEATPDGSSAFFLTEAQLLPQKDTDTAFDIYDARVCTTDSPCQSAPQPTPTGCKEVQTCRPAPPESQSSGGPAGSATFSGPGNPQTATKPQVQVRGKQSSKQPTKRLTRKQKRAGALRSCRRRHAHSSKKRRACERAVRKRYRKRATHAKHKRGSRVASRGAGR
jgi:hypothetical protein